jgi:hypothetical protein
VSYKGLFCTAVGLIKNNNNNNNNPIVSDNSKVQSVKSTVVRGMNSVQVWP